ncbi:maltose O-acetyltransferase [Rubricella aquisinus]|uniref:Nodulation protein L n=1 Tax=Rubricella aquisinus TaxID=2028108 RepID=A0A840WZD4_9RHOB|nr:sugar O-acetyltransferase [Rubricella aquisinus]MBB5515804.1 maltose O-acetyltransferase [Rubricella aquisinus]
MTEKEKMIAGALYRPGDPELVADRARAQSLMRDYNATIVSDGALRAPILDALLGSRGPDCAIRAPFFVDYGYNIHLGTEVFFNYGCVLLDVCPITIGDKTQIGPQVQIYAADHPRDADSRDKGLENGKPVTIGCNVWIGGGAILLPGVTIGDDAVIGAGAVVTRDVPAGATAVGNPARVIAKA